MLASVSSWHNAPGLAVCCACNQSRVAMLETSDVFKVLKGADNYTAERWGAETIRDYKQKLLKSCANNVTAAKISSHEPAMSVDMASEHDARYSSCHICGCQEDDVRCLVELWPGGFCSCLK